MGRSFSRSGSTSAHSKRRIFVFSSIRCMKRGHSGTAKKAALSADANDYVMQPNKSLDASGGGVFLNLRGEAQGALIRAAAPTQMLCCFYMSTMQRRQII